MPWHVGGDEWLTWGELHHYGTDFEAEVARRAEQAKRRPRIFGKRR